MTRITKEQFMMPEWMEPYREMFQNTGGNPIESLMNDTDTNAFNNAIRSALIISVNSQVTLLMRMHAAGVLPDEHGDKFHWRFDHDAKQWVRRSP